MSICPTNYYRVSVTSEGGDLQRPPAADADAFLFVVVPLVAALVLWMARILEIAIIRCAWSFRSLACFVSLSLSHILARTLSLSLSLSLVSAFYAACAPSPLSLHPPHPILRGCPPSSSKHAIPHASSSSCQWAFPSRVSSRRECARRESMQELRLAAQVLVLWSSALAILLFDYSQVPSRSTQST